MLRELNYNIPDHIVLHLVASGLPSSLKRSLNRNSIKSTDDLQTELKKYEPDDKINENQNKIRNFSSTLRNNF